jgi:RNA polymerase sigma-70 factor (ECF subfamily)
MSDGSHSFSTSVSLIRRARALDDGAWTVLLQLYGPLVYGWARRMGLQNQDAADVVQNVFVSVWRGLRAFTLDRPDASFRGWLRTITRNAVLEQNRRDKTRIVASDHLAQWTESSAAALPEDSPSNSELMDSTRELAHRALELVRKSVDASTWDAFWQTTIDETPVADVAAALRLSPAAVRQAKYRVLCRLRDLLADR